MPTVSSRPNKPVGQNIIVLQSTKDRHFISDKQMRKFRDVCTFQHLSPVQTGDPGFAEFSLAELRLRVRIPTNVSVSELPSQFQLYTCMLVKLRDGWESDGDLKDVLQRTSRRFRIEDSRVTHDGAVQVTLAVRETPTWCEFYVCFLCGSLILTVSVQAKSKLIL
ncbi:hypothetical protein BOX15_Mlig010099g1 [Macrostomum lignano]|uniref:Uncharacterized protein n=1 Tax=Macrostomum lignano TaxID=282301 RepID=A0A267EJQ5_9PLAT|nr:hypothetical protein BOX15_Mlig010099g1 [Macrostomum lignano]